MTTCYNRKERRALAKREPSFSGVALRGGQPAAPLSITDLMDEARRQYRLGNSAEAEALCRQVLARVPIRKRSRSQSHRNYRAVLRTLPTFGKNVCQGHCIGPADAACHYNIGSSYQALSRRGEAAIHFKKAIALGLSEKNIEEFIMQSPVIATCLDRLEKEQPLPRLINDLFSAAGLEAVADELFLRCAMESIVIRGRALEMFLTHLRRALLQLATANAVAPSVIADSLVSCLSALALQCFINEYVYSQSEDETQQSVQLQDQLLKQLNGVNEIQPLTLAAVAAYFPIYQLPGADKILS